MRTHTYSTGKKHTCTSARTHPATNHTTRQTPTPLFLREPSAHRTSTFLLCDKTGRATAKGMKNQASPEVATGSKREKPNGSADTKGGQPHHAAREPREKERRTAERRQPRGHRRTKESSAREHAKREEKGRRPAKQRQGPRKEKRATAATLRQNAHGRREHILGRGGARSSPISGLGLEQVRGLHGLHAVEVPGSTLILSTIPPQMANHAGARVENSRAAEALRGVHSQGEGATVLMGVRRVRPQPRDRVKLAPALQAHSTNRVGGGGGGGRGPE